jgi:hypothetical protein
MIGPSWRIASGIVTESGTSWPDDLTRRSGRLGRWFDDATDFTGATGDCRTDGLRMKARRDIS